MLAAPIAIAGATALSAFIAQINASTKISLGEAATVFIFIAGLVWWLGRKLQHIEDDIKSLKVQLEKVTGEIQKDG